MFSSKFSVAVLTSIPDVSSLILPHLKSLPVQLLTDPPDCKFNTNDLSKYPPDWLSQLNSADIVIADPENLGIFENYLSNLKWCQSTFAGPDKTIKTLKNTPNLLKKIESNELYVTRMGYALGIHISEYVIANIIRIERRFDKLYNEQYNNIWNQKEYVSDSYRLLKQLKIGIFGIGDIGCCIANSLNKGFNVNHIIGLSRTSKQNNKTYQDLFQKCYVFNELDQLFENENDLDYIICCLPDTKETQYLLDYNRLKKFKNQPILINVGRGSLINENELIKSLNEGILGGAVLDVFEQEPLNKNSELWKMDNVIISPHVSGLTFAEELVDVFIMNLNKYVNEKELDYLVDVHRGY